MVSPRAEARPQTAVSALFPYWGVVLAWMAIISLFSTAPFSAENTGRYIDPLLRYIFPHITPSQFVFWHSVIRKSAHFIEFFILGILTYWALRRGRAPRWRMAWMLQALGLAVLYSLADELHQAFTPSRTPSLADSGVDSFGALVSQAVIYVRHLLLNRSSAAR